MRRRSDDIARAEQEFSPTIDEAVQKTCIATYQTLGCWTQHVEIQQPALEVALDVLEFDGGLKERYTYEQVCCHPPGC